MKVNVGCLKKYINYVWHHFYTRKTICLLRYTSFCDHNYKLSTHFCLWKLGYWLYRARFESHRGRIAFFIRWISRGVIIFTILSMRTIFVALWDFIIYSDVLTLGECIMSGFKLWKCIILAIFILSLTAKYKWFPLLIFVNTCQLSILGKTIRDRPLVTMRH